jgi:hypothetical protein
MARDLLHRLRGAARHGPDSLASHVAHTERSLHRPGIRHEALLVCTTCSNPIDPARNGVLSASKKAAPSPSHEFTADADHFNSVANALPH